MADATPDPPAPGSPVPPGAAAPGAQPWAATRRPPFSGNPRVGARGQRTRQDILDAARREFGAVGYRQCSIERITRAAGCSRASLYQYFSGKEDVLRHLAAQVGRQIDAATEWLDPITADADGWSSLRSWVARFAEIHAQYEPVFAALQTASTPDDLAATGVGADAAERYAVGIRTRVRSTVLSTTVLDATLELLLTCLVRTLDDLTILRAAAPEAFPLDAALDAFTDVAHRSLFGLDPDVNVHGGDGPPPPRLPLGPMVRAGAGQAAGPSGEGASARVTAAAREVFLTNGYHGSRIDDIAREAGVAKGTVYTYFDSKQQLLQHLATSAMRAAASTLDRIPDAEERPTGRAELRRWLEAYNRAQASEMAMIRVWADATLRDEGLAAESAPVVEWGRRRMARFLAPRGFGDVEVEALVLLALIDGLGVRERSPRALDAAVGVIERAFLGRD